MADQAQGQSVPIQDRIFALYDQEPEPQVEEQPPEVETPEVAAPAEDENSAEQQPPAEETATVVDDNGKEWTVPAALKDAFERRADYTRKTQAASALAKQAEDKLQWIEAKEKITGVVLQDFNNLQSMQNQLQRYEAIDWQAVHSANPSQAFALQQERDKLRGDVGRAQQELQQKVAYYQNAQAQHQAKQWEIAVGEVKQRLGAYSEAEDAAALNEAQKLGFTAEDLRGRYADPRILHAIFKASRYEALLASKPDASKAVRNVPPVVKPGAVNAMPADVKAKFAFDKAMKSAKTSTEKARLIQQRIEQRMR